MEIEGCVWCGAVSETPLLEIPPQPAHFVTMETRVFPKHPANVRPPPLVRAQVGYSQSGIHRHSWAYRVNAPGERERGREGGGVIHPESIDSKCPERERKEGRERERGGEG